MKINVMLFALIAALVAVSSARELQQAATSGRVTFFDNGDYSGGGQAFEANVPATGCGDCKNLVSVPELALPYVMAHNHEGQPGWLLPLYREDEQRSRRILRHPLTDASP